MPAGRPSLYKPEYCDVIIELGKEGKSMTAMALACNVSKQTILDWAAAHEEFSDALTRARAFSLQWWEDKARENVDNPKFNSSLWKMMVGSQHREEYGEMKRALELTGPNGGPIQTQTTVLDPAAMDPDARDALRYALTAAARASQSDDKPFEDDDEDSE